MGLWDPVCHRKCVSERLVCEDMLNALQSVRHVDELYHALAGAQDNVIYPLQRIPGHRFRSGTRTVIPTTTISSQVVDATERFPPLPPGRLSLELTRFDGRFAI
jgi:hypothetical protein